MTEASSLAEHLFERGLPTYGLTTGLGAQKRTSLRARRRLVQLGGRSRRAASARGRTHRRDVVRAAMLVLLNQFCGGIDLRAARASPSGSRRR